MKFLVVLFGTLCATSAVPVENGYGLPAAPTVVATPIVAPVVEPALLRTTTVVSSPVPLAPSPLRFLAQPAPFVPAPLAAPVVPTPLAPAAPLIRGAPLPLPLRAAPVPIAAAPAPIPLAAAPVPLAAAPVPAGPVSSQFHAQDELGAFSFGYQNLNSARSEVRTPDGITRGSYNYVDANGQVQQVEYIADPVNGFRVAGTNLPVASGIAPVAPVAPTVVVEDTAEVIQAKAEFQRAFDEAVARNAALEMEEEETASRKRRHATTNDYGVPATPVIAVPAPVVPVPAPVVVSSAPQLVRTVTSTHVAPIIPGPARLASPLAPIAPIVPGPARLATPIAPVAPIVPGPVRTIPTAPVTLDLAPAPLPLAAGPVPVPVAAATQFQAQDETGGVSFGYENALSSRQESRSPDGVTTGSYSYVDANGVPQVVNYIADALGFRVQATNLPVGPAPVPQVAIVA